MRFVCDSCRAQYMISDDKVGAKGVKVRCKKCGHVILVRAGSSSKDEGASEAPAADTPAAAAGNGATGSSAAGPLASLGAPPEGGLFTGVEEDEIGAVFDQVLNSGSQKIPAGDPLGAEPRESKSSTLAAVSKLAEAASEPDEPQAAAPANDWYVAIDEKQVGPLSIEKVKEYWDRGEVGPDSLCWRAGLGDWIPLSEATELASVLAPRPAKPVIVAPAAVAAQVPSAPAPVESAFSAGAAAKNTRTEVPAAPALGQEPTSSGWKPSAASVLASLVKEENEALSKPPPKPVVEEKASVPGLLDLPPPEPAMAPAARAASLMASAEPAMRVSQPAAMPYAPAPAYAQPAPAYAQPAPAYAGYPQPAYPGYPPSAGPGAQGGNNKMFMVAGLAAVGALLLGAVLFFALRESPPAPQPAVAAVTQPPAAAQPEAAAAPPPAPGAAQAQPVANPAVASPTPPAPAPGTAPAVAPAAGGTPPAVATPQPAAATPTPPPAVAEAPTPKPPAPRVEQPAIARQERPQTPKRTESGSGASAPAKPKQTDDGLDDDFDDLFGPKKPEKKGSGGTGSTPSTYIPPEPGSASSSSLEKLGQSDIMAVVVANKPAIKRCVDEQKKRDPGSSGRLVMRWTIQPSGRTTGVSIRSDEFRKTYLATCMSGLIKSWTFPKHRKQGAPIDFPFIF
ncbi:MAG: adventurous gliding motility protein GltJ [Myxococcaceae bacterium]|nr:adventurous gliding motility protein GltJ [Myxococcaceae bacterium]